MLISPLIVNWPGIAGIPDIQQQAKFGLEHSFCCRSGDAIILVMSAQSLHFDLPDAEHPGIFPWLIVLLCAACLIVLVTTAARAIPQTLQQQAKQLVESAGFDTMQVTANGRDLILDGSIDQRLSVAMLVKQLESIDGVRIVRDEMTRFDPDAIRQQRAKDFLQQLARIDVSSVAFEPNSSSFSPGSQTALNRVAELLREHPDKRIRIEGHTDNTGPATVNMRLSQQRAQAVARYLEARAVSPQQLLAKGYGDTQPIADNNTANGRARNRRIDISYVD